MHLAQGVVTRPDCSTHYLVFGQAEELVTRFWLCRSMPVQRDNVNRCGGETLFARIVVHLLSMPEAGFVYTNDPE